MPSICNAVYSFFIAVLIYHNLVTEEEIHLLAHSWLSQKSRWTPPGSVLRASQGRHQDVGCAGLLTGGSGEEPTSRVIPIVGRCQFLAARRVKSSFPRWLSARPLSAPRSYSLVLAHSSVKFQSQQ